MQERFSARNEIVNLEQINECRKSTRTRIWQVFSNKHVKPYTKNKVYQDIVEEMMAYLGLTYESNVNISDHKDNINALKKYITEDCEWNIVYDFIEYYLKIYNPKDEQIITEFNEILTDEKTGYSLIINNCSEPIIVPITNKYEIQEINNAVKNSPSHIAESINKSLSLFSEKKNPDYNNAIKEAINAVEALCCTIVNEKGFNENTLGKALNKFGECGIHLHESLIISIKNLYKYTSNEDGIIHGGTDYIQQNIEDARFMIVTCSAIINLLCEKYKKIKESKTE